MIKSKENNLFNPISNSEFGPSLQEIMKNCTLFNEIVAEFITHERVWNLNRLIGQNKLIGLWVRLTTVRRFFSLIYILKVSRFDVTLSS